MIINNVLNDNTRVSEEENDLDRIKKFEIQILNTNGIKRLNSEPQLIPFDGTIVVTLVHRLVLDFLSFYSENLLLFSIVTPCFSFSLFEL